MTWIREIKRFIFRLRCPLHLLVSFFRFDFWREIIFFCSFYFQFIHLLYILCAFHYNFFAGNNNVSSLFWYRFVVYNSFTRLILYLINFVGRLEKTKASNWNILLRCNAISVVVFCVLIFFFYLIMLQIEYKYVDEEHIDVCVALLQYLEI